MEHQSSLSGRMADIYRRFGVALCLYLLELLDPGEWGFELL